MTEKNRSGVLAVLATAPAVLLFLLLGVFLMDRHDLS